MSIKNYSKYFDKKASTANHAPFFPPNIFAIVAGSTGCGKTNLLLNLLLEYGFFDYGSVHVYCSTLHQSAYQCLMKHYSKMESDIRKKYKVNIKIAQFYSRVWAPFCGIFMFLGILFSLELTLKFKLSFSLNNYLSP